MANIKNLGSPNIIELKFRSLQMANFWVEIFVLGRGVRDNLLQNAKLGVPPELQEVLLQLNIFFHTFVQRRLHPLRLDGLTVLRHGTLLNFHTLLLLVVNIVGSFPNLTLDKRFSWSRGFLSPLSFPVQLWSWRLSAPFHVCKTQMLKNLCFIVQVKPSQRFAFPKSCDKRDQLSSWRLFNVFEAFTDWDLEHEAW